jgi:hypothetical protein
VPFRWRRGCGGLTTTTLILLHDLFAVLCVITLICDGGLSCMFVVAFVYLFEGCMSVSREGSVLLFVLLLQNACFHLHLLVNRNISQQSLKFIGVVL